MSRICCANRERERSSSRCLYERNESTSSGSLSECRTRRYLLLGEKRVRGVRRRAFRSDRHAEVTLFVDSHSTYTCTVTTVARLTGVRGVTLVSSIRQPNANRRDMTHRDPLLLSAVAGHSRVRVRVWSERAPTGYPDARSPRPARSPPARRGTPLFPPCEIHLYPNTPHTTLGLGILVRHAGAGGWVMGWVEEHGWHRDEGRSAPAAPRKLQFLSRYTFMLRILAGLLPERVHSHRQNAPAPLSALAFIKDSNIMFCAAPVLILRSTFTDSI